MTLKIPSVQTLILSLFTVLAVITFLLEWQYSPLNKAIAWYHLKTGSYESMQESSKYVSTLLNGQVYSAKKQPSLPYLTVTDKTINIIATPRSFVSVTAEDSIFPLNMSYTFPKGRNGSFELQYQTLFVEGRKVSSYKKEGQTISEPVNQIIFIGKKSQDEIRTDITAQWKLLVTALTKKDAKTGEPLVTSTEFVNFSKTTKIDDLSYRIASPASIALNIGEVNEQSIKIGVVTLKQKDCSIYGEIPIIYLKQKREYQFDRVHAALASICTKPKPKTTGGLLSCSNCWLAPVSKQYSLLSYYAPYVVATGLKGGGYVTPDTKTALGKLFADANANGVKNVRVSSSFRSYSTQISLFNSYVANEKRNGLNTTHATEKANTYSAKPGHSEHQLGTTVDLMSCASPCSFYDTANNPLFAYLKANAHKFGFIISYSNGSQPYTGYVYEPWHIRYIGTTNAKELYNRGYLTKRGYYLYQYLLEKGSY